MRVTNSMMANTLTRYLLQHSKAIYDVQEQISTQKKINKPSDDPIGIRNVLDFRNKIGTIDQYLDNIDRATTRLESTEITLDVVDDMIGVVREVSQQQAMGTAQSRLFAADQVKDLYNQVVALANSKSGKNYMFAGHQTDTPAFGHAVKVAGGTPGNLEFGLAANATNVTIDVLDENGAVINTITPASGADGFNSVAWSGPVPADGVYAFTVTASNAGVNVVDYSTYHGDSGSNRYMIGENSEITLPADGRDIFTPNGQVDTFEVMADLITALEQDDTTAITNLTQELDAVRIQISEYRASSAPKMYQLEHTENFWSNYKPQLEKLLSETEDANLNEAAMRLNQLDLAYQSTIATAARIIQPTLMNFLK